MYVFSENLKASVNIFRVISFIVIDPHSVERTKILNPHFWNGYIFFKLYFKFSFN